MHSMPGAAFRLKIATPVALLATVLVVSCLGDPSGPRLRAAHFALAPSFSSAAAGLIGIDSVQALLHRTSDSSIALDTTVQVAQNDSVIDLNLVVPVDSTTETFWLTLNCYSTDELVFVGGPLEVTATTSEDSAATGVQVDIEYVGVGSNAQSVQIVSAENSVLFGETLTLSAEALDSSGAAIGGTPIRWTSLNTQRAAVPDQAIGRVVGGTQRGAVEIEAMLLTDQTDTATVLVNPVPNAIAIVSGNDQTGFAGTQLPQPLVVRVTALDGLGVAGATVDFSAIGDGSFSQTSVVSDTGGLASTMWTLGLVEGTQTATATLSGYGDPLVTFSATAEPRPTVTGNVLVISNASYVNASIVDTYPVQMPGFTFDSMDVSVQIPTLEYLLQYPVVLLFEDGLFANSFDVGDTVAAYVQAGGNLVIGTFYWQDRSDNLEYPSNYGWGALEQIDPFLAPEGSEYRGDSLDTSTIVAHPLTSGVNSLGVNSYHGGVVAKQGTTVLAWWSDPCIYCETNSPLIGYREESQGQRIVGVTVAPGYVYYGGFTGDFYRLWENALGWAIEGSLPAPPAALAGDPIRRSHPTPASTSTTGGTAGRPDGR
jgi:hypothetical protein